MSAQPDNETMQRELEAAGWTCQPIGVPNWPDSSPWRSPGERITASNMAAAWQLLQQRVDPDPLRREWDELRAFFAHCDTHDEEVSFHLTRDAAGDWALACNFGREAPDSPMAGAALYGYGGTVEEALGEGLAHLSPTKRGLPS